MKVFADYGGSGWEDNNPSVFVMTIISDNALHGEYQLTNGYGLGRALQVLQVILLLWSQIRSHEKKKKRRRKEGNYSYYGRNC